MNPALESLRVGLEAGIAAQLALFALFLLIGNRRVSPAGFFLAAICAALATTVVLNAAASAGLITPVRLVNYFIELLLGPLLLGFVARAGDEGSAVRRGDWVHALGPVLGGLALATGWRFAPDALVSASQACYLLAATLLLKRRWQEMRAAALASVAGGLMAAFGIVAMLRIWVAIDAQVIASYREAPGYTFLLLAVFLLSSLMLFEALRNPASFTRTRGTRRISDADARALSEKLARLVDERKLYLDPNLTVAKVAALLEVSTRDVSSAVAGGAADNFSSFINRRRAEAAARALRSTGSVSITNVMFDSGFGSKSAFQREFKRFFGMSPTEYRQKHAPGSAAT